MAKFPRICVSATGGGSGKTMFSLGLARSWSLQGIKVKPFKKGPDYIDAAWLAAASGMAASNLDPWFLPPEGLKRLFCDEMLRNPGSVAIIEGNRGLYDGLDETGSCSTAHVARVLQCPILLCLDCEKSTRTVAAILKGLASFEDGLFFAGVILNRVGSSRHEESLRKAIEANTDWQVLGALPRQAINLLPERHMGLASFGKGLNVDIELVLDELALLIQNNCDTEAIFECAEKAPDLPAPHMPEIIISKSEAAPVIGFVRDEALWFYYQENLSALENAGLKLREISILGENSDWANLDGLYLGGGFPEDYCEQISNSPNLGKLRQCAVSGMPIYAECGGLVILGAGLGHRGRFWPMAGILNVKARFNARPRGLGYMEGEIVRQNPFFPVGTILRGHEFHYSCLDSPADNAALALELRRGAGICKDEAGRGHDAFVKGNIWASYMHIFAPAIPCWAANFAVAAKKFHKAKICQN